MDRKGLNKGCAETNYGTYSCLKLHSADMLSLLMDTPGFILCCFRAITVNSSFILWANNSLCKAGLFLILNLYSVLYFPVWNVIVFLIEILLLLNVWFIELISPH